MMNHLNPLKTVRIISLVAAIGGLISIIAPAFMGASYEGTPLIVRRMLAMMFQNVYLNLIDTDTLLWAFSAGDYSRGFINIADFIFYVIFLIGAILFATQGFKNVRLVGFCFSVVFFIQCSEAILGTYNVIRRIDILQAQNHLGWTAGFFATTIIWLLLSFYVLKTIAKHRALTVETFEEDGVQRATFISAEKGKRFVHLLVDRLMFILISSTWVWSIQSPVEYGENPVGGEILLTVIYVLGLFLYYVFFESILGATPAKFLTSTKVADEFGNKPSFGTVLIRTLCRFIPFDAISFFGVRGWHDSLSRTYILEEAVALEEQTSFSFEEQAEVATA